MWRGPTAAAIPIPNSSCWVSSMLHWNIESCFLPSSSRSCAILAMRLTLVNLSGAPDPSVARRNAMTASTAACFACSSALGGAAIASLDSSVIASSL